MGTLQVVMSWDSSDADDSTTNSNSWIGGGSWDATFGETAGGWRGQCTSIGAGCSFNTYFYKLFTWSDFGFLAGTTINSIGASNSDNNMRVRTEATGTKTGYHGPIQIYDSTNTTLIGTMTDESGTEDTAWFDHDGAWYTVSIGASETDQFVMRICYRGSVPNKTIGAAQVFIDTLKFTIDYSGPNIPSPGGPVWMHFTHLKG